MTSCHLKRLIGTMATFAALWTGGAVLADAPVATSASQQAAVTPGQLGFYTLDAFGPVKSKAEATQSYQKAVAAIRAAGGGVLIIPGSAAADWTVVNNDQATERIPPPPAPTKQWGFTPGITVIDTRGGTVKIHPPQLTGLNFERTFMTAEGESSPHWEYHPMISLKNDVVRGSTSYLDYLQEDVSKGKDQRFYVPTIRGLFPGMFLNAHTNGGYSGGVERLYVKSLGYDNEKKMWYFVADTNSDHKKSSVLHNKTHVNALKIETSAHNELQTFDVLNDRHHYSQGDSYLYNTTFHYMGNVHSAAGDENGVLYAAFVYGENNSFKGSVAKVDPTKNEVTFTANSQNAQTLGTGRPLINMNPQKWVTGGKVFIVRPASYWKVEAEDPSLQNPVFKGKSYPTKVTANPRTQIQGLEMGGLIQSSADAPWTEDVVGRYFAVNTPDETIPDGILTPGNPGRLRWYLITSFKQNPDGTKEIRIERHWWGSKEAGSPTLYQQSNYSSDGNLKPLSYVIAPGSNVYDVSRAATNAYNKPYQEIGYDRTLLVAPYRDTGTAQDFAPGDEIQQAVGPDPFQPIPFRAWTWDQVPGAFPSPIFDVANYGVPRASVLWVAGSNPKGTPPWEDVISVVSDVGTVVDLSGKITGSAVRIGQQEKPAPITWMYDGGKKAANLAVDLKGKLSFDGAGANFSSGVTTLGGISGTAVEARNLRGIGVAVTAGQTSLTVTFPRAEEDANYAVFLETNWLSQRAITQRTPQGFTVNFATAAPENAKLDWTLVR